MLFHNVCISKSRRHVDCILRHRHFRPLELFIAQKSPPLGKHIRIHKLSHFSKRFCQWYPFLIQLNQLICNFDYYIFNCFWYEWFITYAYIQFDSCDYNLFVKLQFYITTSDKVHNQCIWQYFNWRLWYRKNSCAWSIARTSLFRISCQVLGSLGDETDSSGPGKVGSLYQGCF